MRIGARRRQRRPDSTPSHATASSSAAGSPATRTGATDAQHETEVEPDSFTFGRTTVATFQVGRRVDGAATNVGYAVTADDGATWRSGLLPGLTVASVPAGPNQRASDPVVAYDAAHGDVADLDARAGRRDDAARDQPLARRLDLENAPLAALEEQVAARASPSTRTGSRCDNTPTSPLFGRCYLVYTHSSDRDMLAVRWSDDGGLTWSPPVDIGARPAVGVFPAIRPTGELVVVYLWEVGQAAIAASRSSDGGARGMRRFASPT